MIIQTHTIIPSRWDSWHLKHAQFIAQKSKDLSTKVGAVIVRDNHTVSTGYNGFPPGVSDDIPSRLLRPTKYHYTQHAEMNAILTAHRNGAAVKSCTIYVPLHPCSACARGIISSGIVRVVTIDPQANKDFHHRWAEDIVAAQEMFDETGVTLHFVPEHFMTEAA